MATLDQLSAQMKTEHDALANEYHADFLKAAAAAASLKSSKAKLQAFRAKYGHLIKALDDGDVKVEG